LGDDQEINPEFPSLQIITYTRNTHTLINNIESNDLKCIDTIVSYSNDNGGGKE
jgi:hypothetical protein